jgi:hypothetical protein
MTTLRQAGRIIPILWIIVLAVPLRFLVVSAQTISWSEPVNISNTPNDSWFPDLAVDDQGNVHVIWNETKYLKKGVLDSEQVLYTRWDGREWAIPNDLVAPQLFFPRNAIAIAPNGYLLMVYQRATQGGQAMYFTVAPNEDAWSAASWSLPQRISAYYGAYMADLAVDYRGATHIVFDDTGNEVRDVCQGGCADTYYRRSVDGGQTWSVPINLSRSPIGSSREQIEVDSSGTLHISWDEGWDRLAGGEPLCSVYRSSSDGGLSWTPAITISYPKTGTAQLTAGADGQGGVMLVWRTVLHDDIFYQWSTDHGQSWSSPTAIPEVFARPWTTPFDLYDMATDSTGHIHLLVVGRQSLERDAPLGVYHLVWNGQTWSDPIQVYPGPGFPEYPRLVINNGNHLHAAWFVRDDGLELGTGYEIWYSETHSAAPLGTPVPSPTPAATPLVVPTITPVPSATPYPTIVPGSSGLPTGLHTESDDVFRLAIALSPVVLVVLIVMAIRLKWFSKLRR